MVLHGMQNESFGRRPLLVEARENPPGPETWRFCTVHPSALGEWVRETVGDVVRDCGVLAGPIWLPDSDASAGTTDRVLAALDAAWSSPCVNKVFEKWVPRHVETCLHEEDWGFWAVLEDDSIGRASLDRYGLGEYRDELYLVARRIAEHLVGGDIGSLHAVTVGAFVEGGQDSQAVNETVLRTLR